MPTTPTESAASPRTDRPSLDPRPVDPRPAEPRLVETQPAGPRPQVDPRGARFAAALTAVVLAAALLLAPSPGTTLLVGVQTVVFGLGALRGVQRTPYSWLFRALLRPRLGAPAETEDAAPPRFAQAVGLTFAAVALVGYVAGADLLGTVATGLALAAAFLNAAFGLCLGCELYLLLRRATSRTTTSRTTTAR